MNRRAAIRQIATFFLTTASLAQAQQVGRIPRIAVITEGGDANNPGPTVEVFRQRLREFGYIEGKNIFIELRYTEGQTDRIPGLISELVQLKVDVLISGILSAIRAAKQATKTIPIVMAINGDPVALGLVDSLARPGGNVTGLTTLNRELSGKRLELFKEVMPKLSRVGVFIAVESTTPGGAQDEYEAAARALKIPIQFITVRGPSPDFESAFREAAKRRVSGLIATRALFRHREKIVALAIKHRLPLMAEESVSVEAGALVSYSSSETERYRRVAEYVDKILKGRKPDDLPVEQPMKFEFVINLKAANEFGITIPQWTLMKADRVIR